MTVKPHHIFVKASLFVTSLVLAISLIEIAFRVLGFDLERKATAFRAIPIPYRQPTEPVGEVYFRRQGPDAWMGNVLGVGYDKIVGGKDNPYLREPVVTVQYDRQGFRNPEDLTDWDITVIGDSSTELGFLDYKDLFTTRLGVLLGVRVKNLGVAYTGALTQTFYLKEYGRSPSTKIAILAFFEGNDLQDIQREEQLLKEFRDTGRRPYRNIEKQTSFVKLIYHTVQQTYNTRTANDAERNAYFKSESGEIPVTLDYRPLAKDELTSKQIASLDSALTSFANTALDLGVTPWLVFLPCKRRVLDGFLRYAGTPSQADANLIGRGLPELVGEHAAKQGIGFIDVTPALVEQAVNGVLTFNPIWDTHLNREGSRVVAKTIADRLKSNWSGLSTWRVSQPENRFRK